jgi:sarcosine oxidase, subunit gamma
VDELAPIATGRCCSPLHDLRERFRQASQETGGAITLREIPFMAQIGLRGDVGIPAFREAVREVLGIDVPTKPNTYAESSVLSALWLGPDEWLLVGDPGIENRLIARLSNRLSGIHSSVVNLSDARTVVELSGARSRELLAKGCSLDLHPRAFRAGECAQTNLARANIVLQQLDRIPVWRLYVRASFAGYLATWILDAMSEFRERPKTHAFEHL